MFDPITLALLFWGSRLLCNTLEKIDWDKVEKIFQLTWDTVNCWFSTRKMSAADMGNLVKKSLANGNVAIVAGVFNGKTLREQTVWECHELDAELQRKMGTKNEIRLEL